MSRCNVFFHTCIYETKKILEPDRNIKKNPFFAVSYSKTALIFEWYLLRYWVALPLCPIKRQSSTGCCLKCELNVKSIPGFEEYNLCIQKGDKYKNLSTWYITKVIIEKSRGWRFLWNRNWDLGWIWAGLATFEAGFFMFSWAKKNF